MSIVMAVFYVNWMVRFDVVSVWDDLIGGFGMFMLEAPSNEENDRQDKSDLGCSQGLKCDQFHD